MSTSSGRSVRFTAVRRYWRARGSPERDSVDIDSFASQLLCVCCDS